ncbi:MAG: response regulator [Pirellulaceae bacterium]|nr:response regulator [Pirellulaceae bacterium]
MTADTKVLVVDDEQVVLDSVRKHLKREGYDIQTVLSGDEAIEILDSGWPEVVITDLMMPGMDGLELLERVRDASPKVPVIMITGFATMRTALQALRQGAFDYIAKPFTRAELQGVVVRAARQASQSRECDATAPHDDGLGLGLRHHLGGHCWINVEPDGSARIGLEPSFANTMGEVTEVELPSVGDYLEQGSVCLRFLTADTRSHTLWSPLSGSVVELNESLRERPRLATKDPAGEGWLIRLEPANLQEELDGLNLT